MKTIRASDIGTYHYCHRAWWYRQSGAESENLEALSTGIMLHEEHGRAVFTSGCLRVLAYILLFLSFVFLSIYVLSEVLGV